MKTSDIAAAWNEMKEQTGNFELFDELEKAAVQELMEAKAHIPGHYLKECGLDEVGSADELFNDRERLLRLAAYFSHLSIFDEIEIGDEVIKYDIHMHNASVFVTLIVIEFTATLWRISGILPIEVTIGLEGEAEKRAFEKVLCDIAGWFDYVKSCECYVENKDSEAEGNVYATEWMKKLHAAVEPYGSAEEAHNYSKVLETFRLGMETDSYAVFPAMTSFDDCGDPVFKPEKYINRDGRSFFVIQTRPCDRFSLMLRAGLPDLASALLDDKSVTGFVINPYDEAIYVSRAFVSHVKQDLSSKQKHFKITVNRPMSEEKFCEVEHAIRSLVHEDVDSYLTLSFKNPVADDDILFMQAKKWGEGYHVEIAFDMTCFEWEHPLILAADDVSEEMSLELFRRIGLEAEKTEDIGYIDDHFRDIGFGR